MDNRFLDIIKRILIQAVFIFYSITILAALFFMITAPFRTGKDIARGILSLPSTFTFENIISVWNGGLNIGFRNSMFLGITTSVITIIIGGLAAYAFAFLKFRYKNVLFYFMISGLFISIVLIVIPLFIQYRDLDLINTYIGAILIYVGIRLPFSIYLFRNYFEEFPHSVFEAARIDGASDMGIFTKIVFPLAKPVTITIIMFNFIAVWTDLLIGLLFLQGTDKQTLMLKIVDIFFAEVKAIMVTPLPLGFAGLFISLIPLVTIYFFAKRYYLEGLTMGSVKQ